MEETKTYTREEVLQLMEKVLIRDLNIAENTFCRLDNSYQRQVDEVNYLSHFEKEKREVARNIMNSIKGATSFTPKGSVREIVERLIDEK